MDNSNNNGLEYDDNSDMSDKKPHRKGFRNGFGVGIATGIVTTIVLGLIVLFAYTMIYRQERAYRCKKRRCA